MVSLQYVCGYVSQVRLGKHTLCCNDHKSEDLCKEEPLVPVLSQGSLKIDEKSISKIFFLYLNNF